MKRTELQTASPWRRPEIVRGTCKRLDGSAIGQAVVLSGTSRSPLHIYRQTIYNISGRSRGAQNMSSTPSLSHITRQLVSSPRRGGTCMWMIQKEGLNQSLSEFPFDKNYLYLYLHAGTRVKSRVTKKQKHPTN